MNHQAIRAVHLRVEHSESAEPLAKYIREGLGPLGVNTLVIELNPGYNFKCFPELANGTFGKEDAKIVAAAAKEAGIRVVPLFMCLGHQGWLFDKNTLLTAHPEFDETPHMSKEYEEAHPTPIKFYCHSWCASNDDVYKYVFPMMDEIMEDFGADWLHVGMDEVFSLADENCPRCKGKNKAELFARTVNILHKHIVDEKGWTMMMWADRLNDAETYGYSAWDGDKYGTWPAVDMVPKDIVMTDWHYDMNERGFAGVGALAEKGFTVVPAGWRELKQTRYLLEESLKHNAAAKEKGAEGCVAGLMITSWFISSEKILADMLEAINARTQDEEDKHIKGIASSIVYMAEKLKDYQP